ncbi:MAG: DUF91 domain-containing protein [Bacteroidales bacterium]|nr:DUF91 domain-containing protein [Bacteroidales bacterium]
MSIYEKPVRLLMKEMVKDVSMQKGDRISKDRVLAWFKEKYPKIKQGTITAHLIRMSVNAKSRHHYNPKPVEDDLFYQIDGGSFRLFDTENDPATPQTETFISDETEPDEQENYQDKAEFAYEKDLQNFLSRNLSIIDPGLHLYEEEGITGVEFPAGGRYIDILALDSRNNYVVIELKVSRGYDRTVGQILRYIAWLKKNHAESNQSVRGIIIAREISSDLLLACQEIPNVELFEYDLSISLRRIN